jgi:hypothetical protein
MVGSFVRYLFESCLGLTTEDTEHTEDWEEGERRLVGIWRVPCCPRFPWLKHRSRVTREDTEHTEDWGEGERFLV